MLPHFINEETRALVDQIFEKIKNNVMISLTMEPEEMQIEGNASALDDEEENARTYKWIRDQIDDGNDWAWCSVTVTVTLGTFSGSDSLGGCSYESEKAFRVPGGYYSDMVWEATQACAYEITQSIETLRKLELIP